MFTFLSKTYNKVIKALNKNNDLKNDDSETDSETDIDNNQKNYKNYRVVNIKLNDEEEEIIENNKDIEINTSVYIFTSPELILLNRYKIGKHKGDTKKLIHRYITSFPQIKILNFTPCSNNLQIEKFIKKVFYHNRIMNINKRKSEVYELDDRELKKVHKIIDEYANKADKP
jgi:hypothetical protein